MQNIGIVGWERILPELATFFTALKMREKSENDLAPFNLFLYGRPGTNKTAGITHLCQTLGYSVGKIDCSTLDDVAELAGVIDIHANRTQGINKIIEGELLNKDILILDEFLNTKPHVTPQFRLMLQRLLILLAKAVPMNIKCLIATANLSEDMDAGEANVLDSPTADRFAMLIRVPSFHELNTEEKDAVIEKRYDYNFEKLLKDTVDKSVLYFQSNENHRRRDITRYVRVVAENLKEQENQERTKKTGSKTFSLSPEGRKAQILGEFMSSAVAVAEQLSAKYIFTEVTLKVTMACLSVPKLTGEAVKTEIIKNAHDEGMVFLQKELLNEIEIEIIDAPTIVDKIAIMARNMEKVALTTKIDLANAVIKSDEPELQLAFLELLNSKIFSGEPAEFQNMSDELKNKLASKKPEHKKGLLTDVPEIPEGLNHARSHAILLSGGDATVFANLMKKTRAIIVKWGL